MDKKLFIKNRPFDVNDANDMLNWTEAAIQNVIKSLYSYGIMSGMAVTVNTGLIVNVGLGTAFDSNFSFINVKTAQTATLTSADVTYPRYDKIVISYNASTTNNVDTGNTYGLGTSLVYSQNKLDSYTIQVVKGTAAASPTVPATPTGSLALAQIYIPANNNTIIAGNITDLRSFARASNTNMLAASTSQAGTVQLTDSTTSTSITTAATPNSVKTVMDLVKNAGVGDIAKNLAASTDLNTLSGTGFYTGSGLTNAPSLNYFFIIHMNWDNTTKYQIAYRNSSTAYTEVWIRYGSGATWQNWVQMATNAAVTSSSNGLMISTDKAKLDAINQTLATTSSPTFSSLTANGNVTSTGKFLAAEGTGSSGGYSFSADNSQDTGMFSPGDGDLRFYANAQDILDISITQVTSNKKVSAPNFISTIGTGTAPFTVTSTTKVNSLNVDMVDGFDFDQSLQTTDSPTFSGMTIKSGIYVNNNGTLTNSGFINGVAVTGNYLTSSAIGDTVIRNESNKSLLFGFVGASGTETPALKISYNGGTNKATVFTQRNTLDDGLGNSIFNTIKSTVTTGTAPFIVSSTTKVANLNADLLDGFGAQVVNGNNTIPVRGAAGDLAATTFTSSVATGTSPFNITSTTKVPNLNADKVDGYDFDQSLKTTDSPSFADLNLTGIFKMTASDGTKKPIITTGAGDVNGMGIWIGGGGLTVIGSGESMSTFFNAQTDYTTEQMYVTSDSDVNIITNLQSGVASGKTFTFSAGGNLTAPGSISGTTFTSTIATGTAPLTVASTTKVTNLNVDKVDGYDFNQSLQTTDNVTHKNITATGTLSVTGNTTLSGVLSMPNAKNSLATVTSAFSTVSQNVETTIPFAVGTGWSAGTFTAPDTGVYIFMPSVYLNVTSASAWINCYKNGTMIYQVDKYGNQTVAQDYVLHGPILMSLTAGDTVKFTLTNGSASCNINYAHTYCSTFKVS